MLKTNRKTAIRENFYPIEERMFSAEAALIILIIKRIIYGKDEYLEDLLSSRRINWGIFKELSIYHGIAPFIYSIFKELPAIIPASLMDFLRNDQYSNLVNNQILWQEFLQISKKFEEKKIAIVPIKGTAFLEDIYKQHPFRPMLDVDILVREEEVLKAEAIICSLGYKKELFGLKEDYWKKKQCHLSFCKKDKPLIEMHFALDFKRNNHKILPRLWERIRKIYGKGEHIQVLSVEDSLFSLCLHLRRLGKTLSLKNVCDAALLLNKYRGNINWEYLLKQAYQDKMRTALFFLLSEVVIMTGVGIPKSVLKELNISKSIKFLIEKFIYKNTFSPNISKKVKDLYAKEHFLLYDSLIEPLIYILKIPKEQFAKFYNLKPYNKKTDFLYKIRLAFIIFKAGSNLCKPVIMRIIASKQKPNFFKKNDETAKGALFFKTQGFSMWPFLKTGDKVVISKRPAETLKIGDVILYRTSNKIVCHRLIREVKTEKKRFFYARGDSSTDSAELVDEKMILGKIASVIKNGQVISYLDKRQEIINLIIVYISPLIAGAIGLIKPLYGRLKRGVAFKK
ncbi:MAG: nucleotidyltransferase family protein [Candidatus Omnitrophica bacterium]|nr:nucleotidyltransferase family protein [Candidatus Omnitrophota bacterium]MBU1925742.1 nucleotidyltransferase family protein [Candidatus Omnitrophota bacterium]